MTAAARFKPTELSLLEKLRVLNWPFVLVVILVAAAGKRGVSRERVAGSTPAFTARNLPRSVPGRLVRGASEPAWAVVEPRGIEPLTS